MSTTPSGIWYPGGSDAVVPLQTNFATMATSIENSRNMRLFANTTARDNAYTVKAFGMCVVGADYATGLIYIRRGAGWDTLPGITVRLYATTGDRDTAYAASPFKICVVGASFDAGLIHIRNAGGWAVVDPARLGELSVNSVTYTPVLNASTTNPTGYTASGQYARAGMLIFAEFAATLGSSVGVGNYSITLPVNAAHQGYSYGMVRADYNNGSFRAIAGCDFIAANEIRFWYQSSTVSTSALSNTTPGTMKSGGYIRGSITYTAAV